MRCSCSRWLAGRVCVLTLDPRGSSSELLWGGGLLPRGGGSPTSRACVSPTQYGAIPERGNRLGGARLSWVCPSEACGSGSGAGWGADGWDTQSSGSACRVLLPSSFAGSLIRCKEVAWRREEIPSPNAQRRAPPGRRALWLAGWRAGGGPPERGRGQQRSPPPPRAAGLPFLLPTRPPTPPFCTLVRLPRASPRRPG